MMLDVEDLHVAYGGAAVLNGVSLGVAEGEFVAVLGSNGAGKTTLLRALSGLVRPHRGKVSFCGQSIHRLSPDRIVATGIVHCPEGRRVFSELTVLENLRLGATRKQQGARERLDRVLTIFPILHERRNQAAAKLSGGEQQMLAIGRSLMADPRLLMLDEPSLGLAPQVVELVFDVVTEIQKGGVTTLLVEQNAELALSVTDRAYVLERGRVVAEGPSASLLRSERVREIYLGIEEEEVVEP